MSLESLLESWPAGRTSPPTVMRTSANGGCPRPLNGLYPILSSDQQRALLDLRLAEQSNALHQAGQFLLPTQQGRSSQLQDRSSYVENLSRVLSPEAAFEVSVRESPLASQLRTADAGLSEPEFRAVYKALSAGMAHHTALSMEALASVSSQDKALRVLAALDPGFAAMKLEAGKLQVNDAQLMSVYLAMREVSDLGLKSISADGKPPSEQDIAELSQAMQERDRHIAEVVGKEAAIKLISAVDATYQALATPQTPTASVPTPRALESNPS